MTSRERVLRTLRREKADRVPKMIYYPLPFGQYFVDIAKKNIGDKNPVDFLNLDISGFVSCGDTKKIFDATTFFKEEIEIKGTLNEWGGVWQGDHISPQYPMENYTTSKEVEEYPFPDVDADYRWKDLPGEIKNIKASGYPAIQRYECGTFEQLWELRGMENIMMDFLSEPEYLLPLLEKVSDLKAKIAANYAKAGVDIVWTGDDLGSESSMLIDPETWRKFLKPCSEKIVQAAKAVNPDVLVAFHSDGHMEPVIPDLIEIGVDVLHPVQPECMDINKIFKKYGQDISFWGTIGCQHTLATGSAKEVRTEVQDRLDNIPESGGLLIAPSHFIYPPTPWENIMTFVEAVEGNTGKTNN